MLCKKLVCSSGVQKLPHVQDSNAVLNNKLKCNSLHCKTSDTLKIYICWPPFSAPHPFLQALFIATAVPCRSRLRWGRACSGINVHGDAAAKAQQHEEARSIGARKHFSQQTTSEAATWSGRDGEHKTVLFRSSLRSYSGSTGCFI